MGTMKAHALMYYVPFERNVFDNNKNTYVNTNKMVK